MISAPDGEADEPLAVMRVTAPPLIARLPVGSLLAVSVLPVTLVPPA